MRSRRILLALIVVGVIGAFFAFDLGRYLSLDYFKSQQAAFMAYYHAHPGRTILAFFLVYVAVTGLSLPGAAVMTLVGGAVFGLLWGTVIVSFASTIGATTAFLVSRFVLRDWVQGRFRDRLATINDGVRKDGAFYLFTLRLVVAVPFFVINLVMGLTPIRTGTFYLVSQIGMLPGTIVFVNAGTQLAKISSVGDILSPGLILSFALVGVFPLIAKKVVDFMKTGKVLRNYPRPKAFDRNLVVIGAGSAGLVTAYIAAAVKAKVTLIEKHKMGGECLNLGCVPSKALIRSARFLAQARRAKELGFRSASVDFDFGEVMERVQRVIKAIEPHDSVERYTGLGVECILGEAKITSPYTVQVDGRTLTTRAIVVAAGGTPFIPPIPGIDQVGYRTSDDVWELRTLPKRLIVLGGGAIGCELTQAFARLGSRVTQVEMLPRIMAREDPEVSEMVSARFREEGIDVRVDHRAKEFRLEQGQKVMICQHQGQDVRFEFDELLVAVGRMGRGKGHGLEELGVGIAKNGTIEVNEYLQTIFPNIYACGDVAGPYQFTHMASHQAWFAAVNALFGAFRKFKVDYSVVPWATFTDPEVARVGLSEEEAKEKGIAYEVTRYGIDELDRAITEEEAHGFVKVLTIPGKDRILGVTIVGEHAGEIIAEYVAAMRHGFGLKKILRTIHIYPTFAEANKYAAGEWQRAHAPQTVLRWLERYHSWRLGKSAALNRSRLTDNSSRG